MWDIPPNLSTVLVAVLSSTIVTQWLPSLFKGLKELFTGKKSATLNSLQDDIQKMGVKIDKLSTSEKYLLQYRLKTTCLKSIDRGWINSIDLKSITNMYKSYYDLGGNEFITELYDRVMDLPIKDVN